jgi:hypothetical protein
MWAHVIETIRNGKREPMAIGAFVFVKQSWIEATREKGQPYWRASLVRQWLDGDKQVLTPEQIRATEGRDDVTLFFVADALANPLITDEERMAVDSKWSESLYELRGCKIGSIWTEVYGRKSRDWTMRCGILEKNDFAHYWEARPSEKPQAEKQPFLLGCTREEAQAHPGTHVSFLFSNDLPVFDLTLRQQELLTKALDGATDEELSQLLNLSQSAIKKRWVAIYDKVSNAMPGWLEESDGGATRGTEKRRYLLNHLRKHPAELHPLNASKE